MRIAVLTRQIGNYHHARFAALAEAGIDFAVISLANEGHFDEFVSDAQGAYETHRLYSGKAAYAHAVSEGRVESDVGAALERIAPDVVAVAGWSCAESFAGIRWASERGRALVMMSDSQAEDAARSGLRERIKTRIVGYCDAGFVAGDRHRDYLASLGIPAERITLGYDVVDNAHFARGAAAARTDDGATRERLGLPSGRYWLASGRFVPKKNLGGLVRAFGEAIGGEGDGPHLCVLGDGELRDEIERQVAESGLSDRVHLLGLRTYDDLPAIYGLAEAFVHPAFNEQWGLVVSEAAASGLPLLVSETAGASQLVDSGSNGFTFDPCDPQQVENALSKVAALSPEERAVWGKRSAEIVADWGPDRYVDGLVKASRMALAARKGPRTITLPDRLLMRHLSRKIIADVA